MKMKLEERTGLEFWGERAKRSPDWIGRRKSVAASAATICSLAASSLWQVPGLPCPSPGSESPAAGYAARSHLPGGWVG